MEEKEKLMRQLNVLLMRVFSMVEINGELVVKRELLGTINNVRFEINSIDHPPPHFHVILNKSREIRIRMKIQDGSFMDGEKHLNRLEKKLCHNFYHNNVDSIRKVWDKRC